MPRILIVDDEAHQCTVLGISFKRRGFDVETMTDWQAAMKRVNPAFIPRNHRIEAVIAAALEGDFGPFRALNAVLQTPYEDQAGNADYALPPAAHEVVQATFCGT